MLSRDVFFAAIRQTLESRGRLNVPQCQFGSGWESLWNSPLQHMMCETDKDEVDGLPA
jgi:hypothetical protein